jgi:endogenous inhibitor of DNA gyrase (YacG/DUF329 family)
MDLIKYALMNKTGQTDFLRCYTCGKWLPVAGAYSGRFCSRECAHSYARCPVCGEYFELNKSTGDGFCSAECAGIDLKDRPDNMEEID